MGNVIGKIFELPTKLTGKKHIGNPLNPLTELRHFTNIFPMTLPIFMNKNLPFLSTLTSRFNNAYWISPKLKVVFDTAKITQLNTIKTYTIIALAYPLKSQQK